MAKTKATIEEDIRAYTIGELQPLTQPIVVRDYDPEWPALFEREATRIRATLGDQVKLLEHVGCVLPSHPGKHSHRIRAEVSNNPPGSGPVAPPDTVAGTRSARRTPSSHTA